MNRLPFDRQVRVVDCLVHGVGVRSTEKMTDVTKPTILKLLLDVGEGCARLHDRIMRGLRAGAYQLDEQWSFVGKKTKNVKPTDGIDVGEQWTWAALDVASRAVVSYLVGKRTAENARALADDLRARVEGRPFVTADGLKSYVEAIGDAWGADPIDFAQLVKIYSDDAPGGDRRGNYKGSVPVAVVGSPDLDRTHTSYIERMHLTVRLFDKRFGRETLCFSRSLRHHRAAVALHFAWYNFVHVVSTLRTSPAMALGVADRLWSVADLVRAALAEPQAPPAAPVLQGPAPGQLPLRGVPFLRLIQGGKV